MYAGVFVFEAFGKQNQREMLTHARACEKVIEAICLTRWRYSFGQITDKKSPLTSFTAFETLQIDYMSNCQLNCSFHWLCLALVDLLFPVYEYVYIVQDMLCIHNIVCTYI